MAWIFASVLVVLLVVSLGFRQFFLGAVCVLGVAGLLFYIYQQHTTQEQAKERQASARSRAAVPGAGTEAAAIWEQRYGKPGPQAAPISQQWPEAVSTPEEAAQAVQRLRAAQDVLQQGQGEQPARAVPPADVRPPPDTIAPQPATTVPSPSRPSALSSAENDSSALAGTTTVPATLTPRVTPIPRVTVIPPSSIPPRATLTPPDVPTPAATLTPRATPTPSAPTSGSALKSCDALKAEIQAKLDAKSLTGSVLPIMATGDLAGQQVIGSCEGNTKKIVLNRARNSP